MPSEFDPDCIEWNRQEEAARDRDIVREPPPPLEDEGEYPVTDAAHVAYMARVAEQAWQRYQARVVLGLPPNFD